MDKLPSICCYWTLMVWINIYTSYSSLCSLSCLPSLTGETGQESNRSSSHPDLEIWWDQIELRRTHSISLFRWNSNVHAAQRENSKNGERKNTQKEHLPLIKASLHHVEHSRTPPVTSQASSGARSLRVWAGRSRAWSDHALSSPGSARRGAAGSPTGGGRPASTARWSASAFSSATAELTPCSISSSSSSSLLLRSVGARLPHPKLRCYWGSASTEWSGVAVRDKVQRGC